MARELRRLGKNVNGYSGETINIASVLADCVAAAQTHGWSIGEIHPHGVAPRVHAPSTPERGCPSRSGSVVPEAPAIRQVGRSERAAAETAAPRAQRVPGPPFSRLYLSTGIHGDEPAGPLAVRQLLQEDKWPAESDLWLCPCLNPAGFAANRRENPDGLDLNREYRHPKAKETLAHIAWLQRQPSFDLCLCLHEDWESHGFYVYELNPDNRPSLAETIVTAGRTRLPD